MYLPNWQFDQVPCAKPYLTWYCTSEHLRPSTPNHNIMILRQAYQLPLGLLILLSLLATQAFASYGDGLPSFRHCVQVLKPRRHCQTFLIKSRSARRRTARAGTRPRYVCDAFQFDDISNRLQLSFTSSSSGTAQPNAITPANTSSPINASPRPKTSSNSTENGPSTAS